MSRSDLLAPNMGAPEAVSTISVTTTASTPIARDLNAKYLRVNCDVVLGVRFDTAAESGSVTACTLANGGTRHFALAAGHSEWWPIPINCTFISLIGAASGTAYLEQFAGS